MNVSKEAEGLAIPPDLLNNAASRTQLGDLAHNTEFWNKIKTLGLAGLGVGAVAGGVHGLYNVARRNMAGPQQPFGPRLMSIPVDEDRDQKLANVLTDWATKPIADMAKGRYSAPGDPSGDPSFYPAALLAVGGGLAGGWKLTDYILDRRRKQDMAAELAKSKNEYELALRKQGDAEASPLGRDLDHLFDLCQAEKQAEGGPGHALGQGIGLGLAGSLALGLASGALTYGMTRNRRNEKLLQRAMHQRRMREMAASPVYAFPSTYVDGEAGAAA